ncbi:hypothetical protein GPROT2_01607 [Gammaproteobacteria bacterium]|nr:hypothetical protein GPROT2_01607 [Gammaproteobacteria bacterium]
MKFWNQTNHFHICQRYALCTTVTRHFNHVSMARNQSATDLPPTIDKPAELYPDLRAGKPVEMRWLH